MTTRRRFLAAGSLLASAAGTISPVRSASPVRIGLTAVILDDKLQILRRWRDWLEDRLGLDVHFVQRRRYREITDLLIAGDLQAAWICGYPYVANRELLQLAAIPSYAGDGLYHSLIIVRADDEVTRDFAGLHGRRFVFSDPDSNSGYLYPQFRLHQLKLRAQEHFVRTFFSWGHPNTVEAVAVGLGDAGAVDSYVWQMLMCYEPDLAGLTRVIEQSPPFGFPPIVARRGVDEGLVSALSRVLLDMHEDPDGAAILRSMGLDGFIEPDERYFDGIERMARQLG